MTLFPALLALTIAAGHEASGTHCGVGEKQFDALPSCFSACYPSSWYVYGEASARTSALSIINFNPERKVSGVFLPDGGAEIVAGPLPPELADVGRWLAVRARGDSKPSTRRVRIGGRDPAGIREYTEAKWYSDMGLGSYMTKMAVHFRVGQRFFEAQLTHWKDDPLSPQYRSALKQVLLSFRGPSDGGCR